uniref:Ig-like domain-containing protein n=1 Tax=Esox lucius TaxID=8010 RepID=A0A3P8YZE0_ESOLU
MSAFPTLLKNENISARGCSVGNAQRVLKYSRDKTASVKIEMTEEVVSCSSQNIYPSPEMVWSTDPPSAPETLQNFTVKTLDSKGLYTVESTVRILGNVSDHGYFCSVISADKAQEWTASLRQQEELIGEASRELSIPCIAPQNLQNFTLIWTFTRTNEPTLILSYDSRTGRTTNYWEGRAGLEQHWVLMGNGSLLLNYPESQENTGTYTCTFSGLQSRHVVQTQVNITETPIGGTQITLPRTIHTWTTCYTRGGRNTTIPPSTGHATGGHNTTIPSSTGHATGGHNTTTQSSTGHVRG